MDEGDRPNDYLCGKHGYSNCPDCVEEYRNEMTNPCPDYIMKGVRRKELFALLDKEKAND